MLIYIGLFIFTTLIFRCGDFVKQKKRIFVDALGIFLLCLIAGMRASSVGTDTATYLQPSITFAISAHDFASFWHSSWIQWGYAVMTISQYEIGYVLVIWICSKVFHTIGTVQFVVELLMIAPLYYVLRKNRDCSVWLGMLTWELLFYNSSFNMIRQTMACSFLVLSYYFWGIDKRKSVIWLVVATLFHKSGLLGIGIFIIYYFINSYKGGYISAKRHKFARLIIVICAGIGILVFSEGIALFLRVIGLGGYIPYISFRSSTILWNQILYKLPGLLILLFNYRNVEKCTTDSMFYIAMVMYSIIMSQFYGAAGAGIYGGRISLFFAEFNVIIYPTMVKRGKYREILTLLLILYLIIYWYVYYVISGIDSTIPYVVYWH